MRKIDTEELVKGVLVRKHYKRHKNALKSMQDTYDFMLKCGFEPLSEQDLNNVKSQIDKFYGVNT